MAEDEEYDEEKEFEERIGQITQLPELLVELRDQNRSYQCPINLNIANMQEINLSELEWHHYDLPPKKIKITNSGHTGKIIYRCPFFEPHHWDLENLILSAKWFQERPFLTGGPLIGNYVFSQLHFHWGINDMEGSEHTVDGTQYPAEMHVVHFKSAYLTQESALYEKDGVVVLVYFLKLQSQPNPLFQILLDYFGDIQKSYTSIKMESIPLHFFIRQFTNDFFIYWGNIKTSTKSHLVLWLVCREPIGIAAEQVDIFRTLLDENEEQLVRNFRTVETSTNKSIYHVNPSGSKYSTLLSIPREVFTLKDKHKQPMQINK